LHDKKDASWENGKHEPMPDSISPAFRDNVYLQSLNDILSDEEDTISNASDVVIAEETSNAKRYGPLQSICCNGGTLVKRKRIKLGNDHIYKLNLLKEHD